MKIKAIVLALLLGSVASAQELAPQTIWVPRVQYQPYVAPVPQSMWVPRVQYQPYQYQGTIMQHRHTPIRTWMFGTRFYRPLHFYSPVQTAPTCLMTLIWGESNNG